MARAGGALTAIDVSNTALGVVDLRDALQASGGVVEVQAPASVYKVEWLTTLLAAAPQLRELHIDLSCGVLDAVGALEGRPPFAPLRLRSLSVVDARHGPLSPALALALADARMQPCMTKLTLWDTECDQAAVNVVVDAVIARQRLSRLAIVNCHLPPAAAASLGRALRDGGLTELDFFVGTPFLDATGSATFCDALHASSTLTTLRLYRLPQLAPPVAAALLGALVGHRSLQALDLCSTRFQDAAAAGQALAALLAANAPALIKLTVQFCGLGEAGLGALLDALPHNHHLRELDITNNVAIDGFMRGRMLPAVRANASLRKLRVKTIQHGADVEDDNTFAMREAQRIVAAR